MKKDGKLIRLMGEASVLPPEDPQRQAVEAEIAGEETWVKKKWLDLLREDELLRLELRRISPPAGLDERLLTIPEEVMSSRRPISRWLGIAAAVLVLVAGAGFLRHFRQAAEFSERIGAIALFAVSDHIKNNPLAIIDDRAAIAAHLNKQVPFEVKIPDFPSEFRLIGGRKCSLGTRAVVYTRWKRRQSNYSLFQFCPKDFDLPDVFPRRIMSMKGSAIAGEPCEVLIWAEKGCAYAIVTGSHTPLDQIITDRPVKKGVVSM